MQVGDLVIIKDPTPNRQMPNWMIQAQKSRTPLLIVDEKPAATTWPENQVSAQVQVLCNAQLWWVWIGALEELSEKCK